MTWNEGQQLLGSHPTVLLSPPLLSLLQGQSQGKGEKHRFEVLCSCLATATKPQEISVNEPAHTPLNMSTVTGGMPPCCQTSLLWMPPAPTPPWAPSPSKAASSLHSLIPKLPEPQRGRAKHLCAGNEIIFNCEEASYTLPLVSTYLQTTSALKSNQDRKAAPELSLLWYRLVFFPSSIMCKQWPLPAIPRPVTSFSGKQQSNCINLLASVIIDHHNAKRF